MSSPTPLDPLHVFSMPPELVSRIFIECLPAEPTKPSPHSAPLKIAQICGRWRTIALDTPQLWCTIYLGHPRQDFQRAIALMHSWSMRARTLPLSLTLHGEDDKTGRAIVEAAMRYHQRWRCIDLCLTPASWHTLLDTATSSSATFPRLRHMGMHVPTGKPAMWFGTPPDSSTPTGVSPPTKPKDPHLTLPSVESVALNDPTILEHFVFPNLRCLRLDFVPESLAQVHVWASVLSPLNRTLVALDISMTTLPQLCVTLLTALPALKELRLEIACSPDMMPRCVAITLSKAALPMLETLVVFSDCPAWAKGTDILIRALHARCSGRGTLHSYKLELPNVTAIDDVELFKLASDTGLKIQVTGHQGSYLFWG